MEVRKSACKFRVSQRFLEKAKSLWNRTTGRHGKEIAGFVTVAYDDRLQEFVVDGTGNEGAVGEANGTVDFHTHPFHSEDELAVRGVVASLENDIPSFGDLVTGFRAANARDTVRQARRARLQRQESWKETLRLFGVHRGASLILTPDGLVVTCFDPSSAENIMVATLGADFEAQLEAQAGASVVFNLSRSARNEYLMSVLIVHSILSGLLMRGLISLPEFFQNLKTGRAEDMARLLRRIPDKEEEVVPFVFTFLSAMQFHIRNTFPRFALCLTVRYNAIVRSQRADDPSPMGALEALGADSLQDFVAGDWVLKTLNDKYGGDGSMMKDAAYFRWGPLRPSL